MTKRPDIRVENSVPSQRQSASSARWAAPIIAEQGAQNVVDFGSGALRNQSVFEQYFPKITLVETPKRFEIIAPQCKKKRGVAVLTTAGFEASVQVYDAVFFICVLHIMPEPRERRRIVRIAAQKLRPGGFLLVDVPQSETYYNRIRSTLRKYRDGHLLARGDHYTFYKDYHADELDTLFERSGPLTLFMKVRYSKHLIRIWQKPAT